MNINKVDYEVQKVLQTIMAPFMSVLTFLHQHAWTIIGCVCLGYYLQKHYVGPYLQSQHQQRSYREATDPTRVSLLKSDMREIRAKQQEQLQASAELAAEKAAAKRREEAERKRIVLKQKYEEDGKGKRLGGEGERGNTNPWSNTNSTESSTRRRRNTNTGSSRPRAGGYNALNPSSGMTSSYRPASRARPGGGGRR